MMVGKFYPLKQSMFVRVQNPSSFRTNSNRSSEVWPPVVSTYDYINHYTSNENRLDRILSLLYSDS